MNYKKLAKAKQIRDGYQEQMSIILDNIIKNPSKASFPVYWENWANRILKLEYLIIDLKYENIQTHNKRLFLFPVRTNERHSIICIH